ncbi:MAG: four helix bundle suffix domain-containing protein [Nitrospirota bacterium]|jgi:four helix bundle suffix protein
MDKKNDKLKPNLIPPHGGYRKLKSYQTAEMKSDMSDPYSLKTASPEVAANTLICLINQASYLLGRQLQKLEQQFLEEGGFTERLYQARQQAKSIKKGRTWR